MLISFEQALSLALQGVIYCVGTVGDVQVISIKDQSYFLKGEKTVECSSGYVSQEPEYYILGEDDPEGRETAREARDFGKDIVDFCLQTDRPDCKVENKIFSTFYKANSDSLWLVVGILEDGEADMDRLNLPKENLNCEDFGLDYADRYGESGANILTERCNTIREHPDTDARAFHAN